MFGMMNRLYHETRLADSGNCKYLSGYEVTQSEISLLPRRSLSQNFDQHVTHFGASHNSSINRLFGGRSVDVLIRDKYISALQHSLLGPTLRNFKSSGINAMMRKSEQ